MKSFWMLVAAIGTLVNFGTVRAAESDPCDEVANSAADVKLELKSAKLSKNGSFVGTFEIQNKSHRKPFSLGLVEESRGSFVFRPDTSIEYMDLSSDWRRLLDLPGSFRGATKMQLIAPGDAFTFDVQLMTAETAKQNGREFRLLLRTYSPRLCVISVPFRGKPLRPPVSQLQSVGGS